MSYGPQRRDLKAAQSKLLVRTDVPLQHVKEMQRTWKRQIDNEIKAGLEFLNTYIEAPASNSEALAARYSITNPQTMGAGKTLDTWTGVYRIVSNRWDAESQQFIQTLRLGFATSLAWDEAFLVGGQGARAKDRAVSVIWRCINPAAVDDCIAALHTAGRFTTLSIQGESFAGTWVVSDVQPQQAEDGSQSIVAVLSILNKTTPEADARKQSIKYHSQSGKLTIIRYWPNIDLAEALTLMTAKSGTAGNQNEKVITDEVEDPMVNGSTYEGTFQAKTVLDRGEDDQTCTIIQTMTKSGDAALSIVTGTDCGSTTYEEYRWDLSETDLDAFLVLNSGGPNDTGYAWSTSEALRTKRIQITRNAEDDTFNVYAVMVDRTDMALTGLANYGGVDGRLTMAGNYHAISIREWGFYLPIADLRTLAAQYDEATVGKRYQFEISRKDDCTFDFRGEITTLTVRAYTGGRKSQTGTDVVAGAKDSTTEATVSAGTTQGVEEIAQNVQTPDGLYDRELTTKTSTKKETGEFTSKQVTAETVTEKKGINLRDADVASGYAAPGSAIQGTHVEVSRTINPSDGTIAAVKQTRVVADQAATDEINTGAAVVSTAKHTAAAAAAAADAAAEGVKSRADNTPREDGTFQTAKRTETSVEQEISEHTSVEDASAKLEIQKGKNVRAATIADDYTMPSSVPAGERIIIQREILDDDTENAEKRTETVKDQLTTETIRDARAHTDRDIHSQANNPLPDASEEAGKINRHTSEATSHGRYRTTDESITPQDQHITDGQADYEEIRNTSIHTEAAAAITVPTTPGSNQVQLARNTPTEAGNVRTEHTLITPQTNDVASHKALQLTDKLVMRTIYTNNANPPELGDSYGSVEGRRNKFGRWVGVRDIYTYQFIFEAWDSESGGITFPRKVHQEKIVDGHSWYRDVVVYVGIRNVGKMSLAQSWLITSRSCNDETGGQTATTVAHNISPGTDIIFYGKNRYRAIFFRVVTWPGWTDGGVLGS